jgi:hypothetical protein
MFSVFAWVAVGFIQAKIGLKTVEFLDFAFPGFVL